MMKESSPLQTLYLLASFSVLFATRCFGEIKWRHSTVVCALIEHFDTPTLGGVSSAIDEKNVCPFFAFFKLKTHFLTFFTFPTFSLIKKLPAITVCN